MNKILKVVRGLSNRGATIVSLEYADSPKPIKNVRLNDSRVKDVPYGKANGPAEFTHRGRKYIRVVDHNGGEIVKVMAVDKIKSITVDGKTVRA